MPTKTEARANESKTDASSIERGGLTPTWTVDVGHGDVAGLTVDDDCYVTLLPNAAGQWRPTAWIPKQVAAKIAELEAKG